MKCFPLILFLFFSVCGGLWAQPSADSLFAVVPREVLPVLDRTARLDLSDLYDGGLPARAENVFGGQAELLVKTADFVSLRTSDVGLWQMKVLPWGQQDAVVVCVRTLLRGGAPSVVSAFDGHWRSLRADWLPQPAPAFFFRDDEVRTDSAGQVFCSLLEGLPVVAEWQDGGKVLVFRKDVSGLGLEDRERAERLLRPVAYEWREGRFERIK